MGSRASETGKKKSASGEDNPKGNPTWKNRYLLELLAGKRAHVHRVGVLGRAACVHQRTVRTVAAAPRSAPRLVEDRIAAVAAAGVVAACGRRRREDAAACGGRCRGEGGDARHAQHARQTDGLGHVKVEHVGAVVIVVVTAHHLHATRWIE